MCFRLIYGDSEFELALPFEEHIENRLFQMISSAEPSMAAERGRNDLARRMADLVTGWHQETAEILSDAK